MSGFITMHREALDHPLLKDAERFRAWFWLIANACWKPTKIRIKGQVIELQRGEMSFSQRFLAEKWGWSKSRVDRFIADLRDHDMIETRSKIGATSSHAAGQGQSILTICNYAKYQDVGQPERGNDEPHSGATAGQQRGNSGAKKNKGTREQDSGIPDGIPPASPIPFDPGKLIFDSVVPALAAAGYPERRAAAITAKWLKTFSHGQILDALARYRGADPPPADPVAFMSQHLHHSPRRTANDQPSFNQDDEQPSDPFARAALERQAARAAGLR